MSLLAVTVIGPDRPGIIADVTEGLADTGVNLEDSTMTLLRGHFAMMIVCRADRGGQGAVTAAGDGARLVVGRAVPRARPRSRRPTSSACTAGTGRGSWRRSPG